MSAFELPLELEEQLRPLGEPVAAFKSRMIALWIAAVLCLVLGLGVLVGLAALFLLPGQAGAREWYDLLKFGFFGLLLVGAGVEGIRRIRKNKGLRVYVFADGLARIQGEAVEVLRWQDIATVGRTVAIDSSRDGYNLGPSRKLTLTAADGKVFEFEDSLSDLKRLRQLVEQYTLPHLFQPVLDTCEEGSDYEFGEVKVNSEGLTHGGSQLPWGLCASIEVAKGLLVVKKQDAWLAFCKVPVSKVPNVHVLIAYAEYVRKYAD
jgi:hypothetical protein